MKRKIKVHFFVDSSKEPITVLDETTDDIKTYSKQLNSIFETGDIINLFLDNKAIILKPSQLKLILVEEINKKDNEEYMVEE